ncbi:hypothetical protein M409DRAFT_54495 [Zasmidium cellare ATCC 36951]|uniref:Xylanolytic transcriptional activator regulatory domain-containing protein n=1 Tax=Zasmidium cellare ATCC 36951 TaxID=1080233 RepID=A0A6A6CKL5_ZASCE|nr:uncharacterized protein M409DRAFT_54495 [Zasmidium cellare ATCC 36951]KAF2166700.1 hypothetical protein M409DRAFT_54495 [Zasmidium cellare ATCC 36951]
MPVQNAARCLQDVRIWIAITALSIHQALGLYVVRPAMRPSPDGVSLRGRELLLMTDRQHRDVLKRHVQRCTRSATTRSRRLQSVPSPVSPNKLGAEPESEAPDCSPGTQAEIHITGDLTQNDAETSSNSAFQHATPAVECLPSPMASVEDPLSASTDAVAILVYRYGVSLSTATAATAAYFVHIHPSLPIVHPPTFSLVTTPTSLASIIVAIGIMYSPQASQLRATSDRMWQNGLEELEALVKEQSMFYKSPWTLQSWILHIVYAFYFNDVSVPATCWAKHQSLIRHLRSCCLMNEQLTLLGNDIQPWLTNITQSLLWTSEEVSMAWHAFVLHETYRHCVFAVLFLDHQMTTPCNTRPSMSNVEVGWDLPMPIALWDASSAEEWFTRSQEHVQRGILSDPLDSSSMLSLARATQLLLSASPPPFVLERLSSSPFAAACMLVSLESLVRDFTTCCYRMPPVLPDPSAYHVLSPEQNRAINAAVNTMLGIVAKNNAISPQLRGFLRLSCWLTRIQLCEPDDLIVSGIVDDSLLASLSTSAHLVLGSSVALRRAVAPVRRRFGEDCSFQAWDEMLKALGVITESVQDRKASQSPWMTVLASRLLLMLWRTLRRAIGEIEQSKAGSGSLLGQQQEGLGLASVLSSVIVERITQMLKAQRTSGAQELEDHQTIERAFVRKITEIFSGIKTPVSDAISKIWREIASLIDGDQSEPLSGGLDGWMA